MIKLKRNSLFLIAVSIIALLFSVSFISEFDNSSDTTEHFQISDEVIEEPTEPKEEQNEKIIVDVKGAVVQPGVYEMNRGERVIHAIEKASGYLEDADKDAINLALLLEDEMVIYVPKYGDDVVEPVTSSIESGKININSATVEQLQEIPGIGPVKASAIISYRDEFGKFKSPEDLMNVTGIGKKTFEKIAEFIEVK